MAKKREDQSRGKKSGGDRECDLDGGYASPIMTIRDLNVQNIRDVLSKSRYIQLLLSLTIVGLFLRFFNLGYNSLWLDEASTHTFAIMSIPEIWEATTGGEFNPPLFYWIEHFMLVFGNNEFVLRFVPALLGVLTIPLVYYAGKEFMDRNVGIIAAAAFAFSPFLVFYSQEARAYSMMLFFVAFAMIFYFRAMKNNEIRNWVLFGLLAALAFWSHFYALVIIGALILYALAVQILKYAKDVRNLVPMIIGWAVFAVICLPLIVATIQLFGSRTASAPSFGLQGLTMIMKTFQQIAGFSDIAMYLLLLLFIIGIVQAFILDKNKGLFLVLLTILTFAISYILSFKMPMVPRYLIFFSIVFFIGIAVSYKLLYTLAKHPGVVYGFIAFLVVLNAPMLMDYYSGYSKGDWRGLSDKLQQVTNPGDFIVVVPGYVSQPLDYYYSNTTDKTEEYRAYTAKDLQESYLRKTNNTIYYIVTGDISSANPDGDALAWLKEHTTTPAQYTGIYIFTSA
ncbi:glycosyltransferase family 39 protein [Methanoregula sp.]|uniref:glycosyltransferase family 39 protein n=1 Tax=Methanoregula sp. TaxID=2052170 RepID=UPI0035641C15